jgi:TRAP-type C4-dicarboxylate transport system permease small subunit
MVEEKKKEKLFFRILDLFSGLLVAGMSLAIFLQVLARYVFDYPSAGRKNSAVFCLPGSSSSGSSKSFEWKKCPVWTLCISGFQKKPEIY